MPLQTAGKSTLFYKTVSQNDLEHIGMCIGFRELQEGVGLANQTSTRLNCGLLCQFLFKALFPSFLRSNEKLLLLLFFYKAVSSVFHVEHLGSC